MIYRLILLLLSVSLFLPGLNNAGEEKDERAQLLEHQKQLNKRVETLRQEQDYLIFLKEMSESDSKYLILNFTAKTGQLKYKNRVLKDFHFEVVPRRGTHIAAGVVRLTKKVDAPKAMKLLNFRETFILQDKRIPASRLKGKTPHLLLSIRDFLSIFYAVEIGATAYVLR